MNPLTTTMVGVIEMDDSKPIFRKSGVSDISMIVELKLRMFEEGNYLSVLHDHAREIVTKKYYELYELNMVQHFVIEVDDQIIAVSGGFIKDDIPYCFFKNSTYGFIGDVYVDPAYRKRGYTRKLTLESIEWLKSRGITTVRLLTSPAGRKLYESIGFVQTEEMVLHVGDPTDTSV
jgi:GNAT superfamily N-acetyltransferase